MQQSFWTSDAKVCPEEASKPRKGGNGKDCMVSTGRFAEPINAPATKGGSNKPSYRVPEVIERQDLSSTI